jgi:hypothetical protein
MQTLIFPAFAVYKKSEKRCLCYRATAFLATNRSKKNAECLLPNV